MKKNIFFLFLNYLSILNIIGQTSADSIIIVNTRWKITTVHKGIICKQAEIPQLYNVPQNITILEIDPEEYHFDIVVNNPNIQTSTAGKNTNAVAAINGSYFNMKTGNSVCYLRKKRTVVDTTTRGEFELRVNGAVQIRKGNVNITPWNKTTEVTFNKKRTVLASGPLLLYKGEICDFSSCGMDFIKTKHPRSAIAKTKNGKILLITVDGRFPDKAEGININELAHFIRILGGNDALNLDRGGSSTLWSNAVPDNGVLNKLCDNRKYNHEGERKVANSICIYHK